MPDTGPPTADTCVLTDTGTERDDEEVVPAALRHLRDVAGHTCRRTAATNGQYPPDLAVAVLADTTAALTELADQIGPYVGDFWPDAGRRVAAAQTALTEARGLLDTARHHVTLRPAENQSVAADA